MLDNVAAKARRGFQNRAAPRPPGLLRKNPEAGAPESRHNRVMTFRRAGTGLVFFYGSFMDERVRESHGCHSRTVGIAQLRGYDLRIDPLSRLVRAERRSVYGVLCEASTADLDRLYAARWMELYRPEKVTVERPGRGRSAALCYVPAGPLTSAVAPPGYVDDLLAVARRLGFPPWYLERIAECRQQGAISGIGREEPRDGALRGPG
jgi:hypothetical protein